MPTDSTKTSLGEPGLPSVNAIFTPEQQPVYESQMKELAAGKRSDPLRQDIMQVLETTDPNVHQQILMDVDERRQMIDRGGEKPESTIKPATQPLRQLPGETEKRAVYTAPSITEEVFPFRQEASEVMAAIERNTANMLAYWQTAKESFAHGDLWEGFKTALDAAFILPGDSSRSAIKAVRDNDSSQLGTRTSSQELLGSTDEEIHPAPTLNDFLGALSPLYAVNLAIDSKNEKMWQHGWTDVLTDPWTYGGLGLPKLTRETFKAGRRLFSASSVARSTPSTIKPLITPRGEDVFDYDVGAAVLIPGEPGQERGLGIVKSVTLDQEGNQSLVVEFKHGGEKTVSNLETLPSTHLYDQDMVRRIHEGREIRNPEELLANYEIALEKAVGPPISEAETLIKANRALGEGKMTAETLEQVTPDTLINQDVIREAILVQDDAVVGMMKWADAWGRSLNDDDLNRAMQYWAAWLRVNPGRTGIKAISGRTLQQEQKDLLQKGLSEIAEEGTQASAAQIMTRILRMGSKKEISNFMEEGSKFSWKETFLNDYMLSGMVTMAWPGVAAATQSFVVWNGVYKTLAGLIPGRSTSPLSGPLYLWGATTATVDMLTRSGGLTRFKDDLIKRGVARDKFGEKFSSRPLNVFPDTQGLTFPQKTAKWMAFPFTLLGRLPIQGIDVVSRFQIMEGMKRSEAMNRAYEEAVTSFVGLRVGFPQVTRPIEFSKRLNEFYKLERKIPKREMFEKAHAEGDFVTMTRTMTGAYTGPLQKLGQTPMGKVVQSFWSVTMQTGAAVGEQLPVGLLSKGVRDEFAAGGERAKEATGKMLAGTVLAGWAAWGSASRLWTSDFDRTYVTGDAVINPRQDDFNKDGIFQGRAINFYNAETGKTTSVSCQAQDPICGILNFAGNVAQLGTYVKEDDPLLMESSAFVLTTMMNILANPLARHDMETLHDALFGEAAAPERLVTWAERTVTKFAPASSMGKAFQRDAHEYQVYQKGLLARIKQALPLGKTDEPLWVNGRGQRVRKPVGWHQDLVNGFLVDYLSPVQVKTTDEAFKFVQDDPVLGEFIKQRYVPKTPDQNFGRTTLSGPMYMRRRDIFGNMKLNGKTYWESLQDLVANSELYKKGIAGVGLDTLPRSSSQGQDVYGLRKTLIEEQVTRYKKFADLKLKQEFPHLAELEKLYMMFGRDAEIPPEFLERIAELKARDEVFARYNMQSPEYRETLKTPPGYEERSLENGSPFNGAEVKPSRKQSLTISGG